MFNLSKRVLWMLFLGLMMFFGICWAQEDVGTQEISTQITIGDDLKPNQQYLAAAQKSEQYMWNIPVWPNKWFLWLFVGLALLIYLLSRTWNAR